MSDCFTYYFNNDKTAKLRTSVTDRFMVEYERAPDTPPETLKNRIVDTAYKVYEDAKRTGLKPCVFYSGGVDSEVIVKALMSLGLTPGNSSQSDFEVWHLVYDSGTNSYDTAYVEKLEKNFNVQVNYIHLSPKAFYEYTDSCFEACMRDGVVYPTMTMVGNTLRYAHAQGRYPILGHGVPELRVKDGLMYHCDFEYQSTWAKIAYKYSIPCCHTFYRRTFELYSQYLTESVQFLSESDKPLPENPSHSRAMKGKLLEAFLLEPRPKYTGHEAFWAPEFPHIRNLASRLAEAIGYDYRDGFAREVRSFLTAWSYTEAHRLNLKQSQAR